MLVSSQTAVKGGHGFEIAVKAPVVRKADNAIHQINHSPVDSAIDFRNVYPLDSDLSGG